MYNQILWTLDNEVDGTTFERLCTDLLGREGYSDIVPIGGGHDKGRDAEIKRWKGIKETGGVTFFQYSLEDAWEGKLKRELTKVKNNNHKIDYYIFVTSQKVTGEKRDKLAASAMNDYGWELTIYDREWLRHRLEEKHSDLAAKYLHVEVANINHLEKRNILIETPFDEKTLPFFRDGEYDFAIAELKRLIKERGENAKALQALAWCQYCMHYYADALANINQSLSLNEKDDISWTIKASILTEDGIQRRVKANLLLARDIFGRIAKSSLKWMDHYNYGNTLHALGNYQEARDEFRKALEIDNKQAMVWKNLGTVYYHLGNHQEEIKSYNKALSINSNLAEALASKGITLLVIYKDVKKASGLIEKAIDVDPSLANHWPHIWYWLGEAYKRIGDFQKVLENAQKGLNIAPSHLGLLNLKAVALSQLWQQDGQFTEKAIDFFKFRVELSNEDYDSLIELIKIYLALSKNEEALKLISGLIGTKTINPLEVIAQANIDTKDFLLSLKYLSSYKKFRTTSAITEYMILLKKEGIAIDKSFEEVLYVVCMIPFGLACDLFSQAKKRGTTKTISKLYSLVQNTIKTIFPRLGKHLAIGIRKDTQEKTINDLSRIILAWPLIALLEFSRITGYIAGIFGIPINEINSALDKHGKGMSRWQTQIMGETLIEINKEIKLLKE